MAEKTNSTASKKAPAGITKMDAVRTALTELGSDARPLQIVGFVKDRFGIDMTPDHVSNYKSSILTSEPGKYKPAPKPPAARPAAPQPTAEAAPASPAQAPPRADAKAAISLEDIAAVKDLVERVGADSLRKLIDVLAR
jgi:hypothetical protein